MFNTTILLWLTLFLPAQAAREILLQIAPEDGAPVIAKITATNKVILDAAPAGRNLEEGWRQLALPAPFEGYVPVSSLDKGLKITQGTPVHYLPTAESARITAVEADDRYEVIRENDDWATVQFYKPITGYFLWDADAPPLETAATQQARQSVAQIPDPEQLASPAAVIPREPVAEPIAIPAPRRTINPDEPISQLDPESLPPENVVWKSAPKAESRQEIPETETEGSGERIAGIMVPPDQTQAREPNSDLVPDKTPRLLTGQLIREIEVDGPAYPIRLKSPEGRLIAYVDLAGIFIADLTPYLDSKVYIRGQIHPLPNGSGQLVIRADTLRLAN